MVNPSASHAGGVGGRQLRGEGARPSALRVLYVYNGDWPRNATRPAKQTRALAAAGCEVLLLSANPNHRDAKESTGWMNVERVPFLWRSGMNRALGFPVFFNPLWIWWVIKAAWHFKPEALIVRDLPLAPLVLVVGRVLGRPVYYEMADVYPVAFRATRLEYKSGLARVARNPWIAEQIDRWVVRNATGVFVVSLESRLRCIEFGANAAAVAVVGNSPEELPELGPPGTRSEAQGPTEAFELLFVGNLLADRGLDVALRATAIARAELPGLRLVIVGDGPEMPRLVSLAASLGINDCVEFIGWRAHADHGEFYRRCDVGILPFRDTEHISITLANKLFDFMGACLPIVASDVKPMRRVLEETGAGVLTPPGDPDAFATAILLLAQQPKLRAELGRRGRVAVETVYSWRHDRQRMLDLMGVPAVST